MSRILIIDDEKDIRSVLRELFESEGYEVVEAQNGKDGLNLFHTTPIDLVITDIVMPEKEGISTIIDLKKENPKIKIIAISGGGLIIPIQYLEYAEKFGADRIFRKPLEFEPLLQAIK